MRYALLMIIVLISLCTGIPNFPEIPFFNVPSSGTYGVEFYNEDIYLNANVLPFEISSGNDVTLYFQVFNKANYDLKDVSLTLYDPCVFNEGSEIKKDIGDLKPNRTVSWSWNLMSERLTLSRECELKFRLKYKGKYSFFQDIVVLTQSEYNTKLLQGTLKSIPISSSKSTSPIQIYPTFYIEQPLLDGSSVDIRINYDYIGDGFINVGKGDVIIQVPENLRRTIDCKGDYTYNDGILTLNNELIFINKKASPSLCTFTSQAYTPIDIKSLAILSNYTCIIDKSVKVRVKGTTRT